MKDKVFYLPGDVEDNPHMCILHDLPCLACALIEAMGEDRRIEALDLAIRVAAQ
jgi:hypothetical protein